MPEQWRRELLAELRAEAGPSASQEELSSLVELAQQIYSLGEESPPAQVFRQHRQTLLDHLQQRTSWPHRWSWGLLSNLSFLRAAAAFLLAANIGLGIWLGTELAYSGGAGRTVLPPIPRPQAPAPLVPKEGTTKEGATGGEPAYPMPQLQTWVSLAGRIQEVLANGYRISGRFVQTTDETKISQPVGVGTLVEVTGYIGPNDAVVAESILALPEGTLRVTLQGVATKVFSDGLSVAGKRVIFRKGPDGTVIVLGGAGATARAEMWYEGGPMPIRPGSIVTVEGELQGEAIIAYFVSASEPGVVHMSLIGPVEEIQGHSYQIGGRRVVADENTSIMVEPQVGAWALVEGILREDGSLLATIITGGPSIEPAPPPQPAPGETPSYPGEGGGGPIEPVNSNTR